MRIAVIGAGSLGSYYGGILTRAGEDVTFVARGATLATLRAKGLTVTLGGESASFTVPVRATDEADALGIMDCVLFCVKAYDTADAAVQIPPLIGPETVVIPVQNGIDSAERIAAITGAANVVGGVALINATVVSPGVVSVSGGARTTLIFGELADGQSARTDRLETVFQAAGVAAQADPGIRTALWSKFLMICAFGGVSALTRLPYGVIVADAATRMLIQRAAGEVIACARAQQVALPEDCIERWFELFADNPAFASAYSSQYHDLVAGRRLEVPYLNGALVRLGRNSVSPHPSTSRSPPRSRHMRRASRSRPISPESVGHPRTTPSDRRHRARPGSRHRFDARG